MSKMTAAADGVCHCSDKLADKPEGAEQLRNSGAEELNTYMQSSSAFFRGVSLSHATEQLTKIVDSVV